MHTMQEAQSQTTRNQKANAIRKNITENPRAYATHPISIITLKRSRNPAARDPIQAGKGRLYRDRSGGLIVRG